MQYLILLFLGLSSILFSESQQPPTDPVGKARPASEKETAPKIPGMAEVAIPEFKKGEEFLVPADPKKKILGVPKFSPLEKLSEQLPSSENADFSKNIVNRIWFIMMGTGLVHPLDLHHAGNPPSHPELLSLLAKEFSAHQFDIKWFLTELARLAIF